ncbi:hypothetical protein [Vampirovibrio chlorellavorus]|uniref:hypothetical protein n=1 Tax=Vampirovibrio chlorellavorus TaxID=758823 RepID=UPI0026ED8583|nr:hypothetical protein [Vampirovibrio chlorellavorus]
MPNSFVFIVDIETYKTHIKYGFCATGKSKKPIENYKTFMDEKIQSEYHDILADLLNVEIGDQIFFYITKEGFKDVYEVTEKLFFDATEVENLPASRPFRILIRPKYQFEKAVPEDSLFLSEKRRSKFWLLYFNKARGKARGCTPLDPDASQELLELLIKYNACEYSSATQVPERYPGIKREIKELKIKTRFEQPFSREDSLLAMILRAYQTKSATFSSIFGGFDRLEWMGSKIPYDITGKNIDLLLYHRAKTPDEQFSPRYKYSVVELKRETADLAALYQVLNYSQAVGNNLAEGDFHLVQPVLIAHDFTDDVLKAVELGFSNHKKPILVSYRYVQDEGLTLEIINKHDNDSPSPTKPIKRNKRASQSETPYIEPLVAKGKIG